MRSLLAARLGMAQKHSPAPASGNGGGTGDPGSHLHAALAAHKKGDHKTARKHALNYANASMSQSAPVASMPAAPSANPAAGGGVASGS